MEKHQKTKEQLEKELIRLRIRISDAEKAECGRTQVEEELPEIEKRDQQVYEKLPLGYQSLNEEGCIQAVNPAWLDVLGYSREEVIGRWFGDFLSPPYTEHFKENFPRFKAAGSIEGVEFEMVRKDRSRIFVSFSGRVDYGEQGNFVRTHCVMQDITERRKAEEAITAERDKAQKYLDVAGVMFVAIDADKKVSLINRRGCEIFEYRQEEIIGKNWFQNLLPEKYRGEVEAVFEGMMAGEIEPVEYYENPVLTRSGGEKIIAWHNTVLTDEEGVITGTLSSGEDITERVLEEKKRKLSLKLFERLNKSGERREMIRDILLFVKEFSGCQAVGIRLKEGEDFPYYETNGFSPGFVRTESQLCAHDPNDQVIRDDAGNPVLECMCGNIICGRFDSQKPFFTGGGSFWTNSTTELLASTSEEDRQARTRNRCNGEGYESVALIPLKSNGETIGLLQLNDRRRNVLTQELIEHYEKVGMSIGIVVARKRAEEALRESEERLDLALKGADLGLWDRDIRTGHVIYNERAAEIYGYSLEEMEQTSDWWESRIHPDDSPGVLECRERHLKGLTPIYEAEYRLHARSGEWKWILSRGKVVKRDKEGSPLRITGTLLDITDRKRAEEEIENIFNLSMDLICVAGFDGYFKRVNPAFERILGYTEEELLSIPFIELVHPDDRNMTIAEARKGLKGVDLIVPFENRYHCKDGSYKWLEWVSNPSVEEHVAYAVAHDITNRKKAEKKLQRYSRQLEKMVEERTKELHDAQADLVRKGKLAILGQMAGAVGHELRNPLSAIKGAVFYLNKILEEPEPKVQRTLDILDREVALSERIISSLLDFARQKVPLRRSLNINSVVRESLSRATLPDNVEVVKQLDEALPEIQADTDQLNQVFVNLILNAVQAMPEGGRLIVRSETGESGWIAVSVSDTGVGIPEDILSKLFEPLFTTKPKGIGLGLLIVKNLVELHGGIVDVRSKAGKGSTFTVKLSVNGRT